MPVERSISSENAVPVVVHEQVLAEVRHEVGNFFHKLYYWAEYLEECQRGRETDTSAIEMLRSTVRGLEVFLGRALEYVQPLDLAPTRMDAAEVIRALVTQLRAHADGTPLDVGELSGWRGVPVSIDPGRFAVTAQTIGRHLAEHAKAGAGMTVRVAREPRRSRTLEIEFMVEGRQAGSPFLQTATAAIEWALAERVVTAHGGTLRERTTGEGATTVTLELPLAQ